MVVVVNIRNLLLPWPIVDFPSEISLGRAHHGFLVVVDLKWVSRLPPEISLFSFLPLHRSFLSLSQFSGHLQSNVYSAGTCDFPFCLFAALHVVHTQTSSNILPAPSVSLSDPSHLLADWHWSQGGCRHPCKCFLMQWRDWVVIVLREPGGVWSAFQAGSCGAWAPSAAGPEGRRNFIIASQGTGRPT